MTQLTIDEALRLMALEDFSQKGKWDMLAHVLREICPALGVDIHLRDDYQVERGIAADGIVSSLKPGITLADALEQVQGSIMTSRFITIDLVYQVGETKAWRDEQPIGIEIGIDGGGDYFISTRQDLWPGIREGEFPPLGDPNWRLVKTPLQVLRVAKEELPDDPE